MIASAVSRVVILFVLVATVFALPAKPAEASPPVMGGDDYPYRPKTDWLEAEDAEQFGSPYRPLSILPHGADIAFDKPWKVVILMVDFSDEGADGDAEYFADMLFGDHTIIQGDEPYPFPSMADLYKKMSGGQLVFEEPLVKGWYRAPKPYTYYTQHDGTNQFRGCHGLSGGPIGAQLLLKEVLSMAEADGVNLSLYDNDGDDVPEGIFVVHAGPGAEQTYNSNPCDPDNDQKGGDIWSHAHSVGYSGATFSSVRYLIGPAESTSERSDTGLSTMGVWAHEFGHTLRLPDLYAPEDGGEGLGIGCWGLMGYAITSCARTFTEEGGTDPNEMSAWTRVEIGWSTPTPVTENVCRRVEPVQNGGEIFKVTPNPDESGDYFYVAYRAQVGLDKDLLLDSSIENKNRVCIWHIDDSRANDFAPNKIACRPNEEPRENCIWDPGNGTGHYGVSLVQPDKLYHLERGDTNAYADAGDCLGPDELIRSIDNEDMRPWSGTLPKHWSVKTGSLNQSAQITIQVTDELDTTPPAIVGAPANAVPGRTWRYRPTVAEPAGAAFWSLVPDPSDATANYPRGFTIDAETGEVSWPVPKNTSMTGVKFGLRVENCGGEDTQKLDVVVDLQPRCGCTTAAGRTDIGGMVLVSILFLGYRLRRREPLYSR